MQGQMRTARSIRRGWLRRHGPGQPLASLLGALAGCLLGALGFAQAASAAPSPVIWRIDAQAAANVPAGSQIDYYVTAKNNGDTDTNGTDPYTIHVELPDGFTAISRTPSTFNCGSLAGQSSFDCTRSNQTNGHGTAGSAVGMDLKVSVPGSGPGSAGDQQATFTLSGGKGTDGVVPAHATAVSRTEVSSDPGEFDVEDFDGQTTANEAGDPYTQAGGTPHTIATRIEFPRYQKLIASLPPFATYEGPMPVEAPRDIFVEIPAGLIGRPASLPKCTIVELNGDASRPTCPMESQVGTAAVGLGDGGYVSQVSVYAMEAPAEVPARFAFNVGGALVSLDASVRSDGDYGITLASRNTSQAVPFGGTQIDLWGTPADPIHDADRRCPGGATAGPFLNTGTAEECPYERPEPTALLRMPTSCSGPVDTALRVDSWEHRGALKSDGAPDLSDPNWKSATFTSHNPPGYPETPDNWGPEQGTTGCNAVPFNPQVSVEATSNEADSPTGLAVDISVPQTSDPDVLGSSDLKDTTVTLPEGFSLNPSAADGLEACTLEQIDLDGQNTEPECPNASKIGTTQIDTPLLEEPMSGDVFLAEQNDPDKPGAENPFDTLTAYYIVAEGPGTVIKLPGKVELDEGTGQIVNTFTDNPQLPFSNFHVEFFDGPRSPIATPRTCGTDAVEAELTPWARPDSPVTRTQNLAITTGPGGLPCPADLASRPFEPTLSSGVVDPVAGSFTPFVFQLKRADGHQEILRLRVDLPPGVTANISDTPRCSEAALAELVDSNHSAAEEIASAKCPAASQVGKVTVGAGAGSNPYYVQTGKAYLAGPYKGAPLSLAAVVPALAGPFDLGVELVRSALHVDPRTAEITVATDQFPTILEGIPLRLRDIRVNMNKPNFMLAGTNCDPLQITGQASGVGGASADLAQRYQLGDCGSLGFSPKLELDLGNAKKSTKSNQHPPLHATLSPNEGDANISSAEVVLPEGVLLDQDRIGRICSRDRYAAGTCPEESRVGYAKATTPLLADPVEGPVYLKASDNTLPDLAADLNGEIDIDLFGRIDQTKGKRINRIRNTFDIVPDVPVSSFELTLDGGSDGLLVNSRNICAAKLSQKVSIDLRAHNEMRLSESPLIGSACEQMNKKKAKKLKRKAKKLLRKAKRTDSKRKAKQLRKQARKLKKQARKLGR